jgi:hypothetical protein
MVVLSPMGASGAVADPRARAMTSRESENTIYFTWDASDKRVTQATSSRLVHAKQKIELLTRLVDRSGRIVMRAVLKNVSKKHQFRIDGRLVHDVMRDDVLARRLKTRVFDTVLGPGDKIVARFIYGVASGDYSARTDYLTK